MDELHSSHNIDPQDQRYRTSGRIVRLLYSLLIFSIITYAVYFFARPFFILEGTGQVVAPQKDISVSFISDIQMVHVRPGQRVYPGALLVTLDRAGLTEVLGEIDNAITNRIQQLNELQRALRVAEQMAEPLNAHWQELQTAADRIRTLSDGVDLLTQMRLQRELSDARLAREQNKAQREQLPPMIAELAEERSRLLSRRTEVLTTWQNYQVVANERGIIGSQVVSEGDVVTPGEVMLRILDQEQKTVLWELPNNILRLPRIGEAVRIETVSDTVDGVVDRILPLSSSLAEGGQSANRLVEIAITDPGAELPLEANVTVRMRYFW